MDDNSITSTHNDLDGIIMQSDDKNSNSESKVVEKSLELAEIFNSEVFHGISDYEEIVKCDTDNVIDSENVIVGKNPELTEVINSEILYGISDYEEIVECDQDDVYEQHINLPNESSDSNNLHNLSEAICNCKCKKFVYDIEKFVDDPEGLFYFTGMESYDKFLFILQTLGPQAYCLTYEKRQIEDISVPNQLFLTFWKLRRNCADFELSRHFNISVYVVENIFITWIKFMHYQWSKLDIWPSRSLIDFYMPESFKINFPFTRIVISGIETPIQKPPNSLQQRATFSSYKNTNTLKYIISTTPGGLICHYSDAYGGSTSYRKIIECSDLKNKFDPKDEIMLDRDFSAQDIQEIQDIFKIKDISVRTPSSFLKDKEFLPHQKLLKGFKILSSRLNHTYIPYCSEIVGVCAMLCNFQNSNTKKQ